LIIRGDQKNSLRATEVWGPNVHIDDHSEFFSHMLISQGIIDIEPTRLCFTWRNNRVGEDRVAKCIDKFLVLEILLDLPYQFRQWVEFGGDFDHFPILMEILGSLKKLASPFKFNPAWLLDESFQILVKENWIVFDDSLGMPTSIQFVDNIKRIKQLAIPWAKKKNAREELEIGEVEAQIVRISHSDGDGYLLREEKEDLKIMEMCRRRLLEEKEASWRMKSRTTWLAKGDENTKLFQDYAKG
jgi:hypothetical protein